MAVAGNCDATLAILAALGMSAYKVRRLTLTMEPAELVTLDGEVQVDDVMRVDFEHLVDEAELEQVAKALTLELGNAFSISADWLEEHGHDEAAAALRQAQEVPTHA